MNKKMFLQFLVVCAMVTGGMARADETRTLTDMFGREVTFKANPARIITIDRGYLPQALKALGEDNRLVATGGVYPRSGPFNRDKTDTMFLVPRVLDIPNIGWVGYGAYDLEKIAETKPDLVIITQFAGQHDKPNQQDLLERLEKDLQAPVFLMRSPSFDDAARDTKDYVKPIRLLGDITGAHERANALAEKITGYIGQAAKLRRESEEKMLILGLVKPEKGVGYVYGEDYGLASYTTSVLGIRNVYSRPENPVFSAEKILEFNPDVIVLVDGPGANKFYDRFQTAPLMRSVKAVKNRRVHSVGQLSWWGDSKLMLPVQLMIYANAYYNPGKSPVRRFYHDYMKDVFGVDDSEMTRLMRIQKLNWLAEAE